MPGIREKGGRKESHPFAEGKQIETHCKDLYPDRYILLNYMSSNEYRQRRSGTWYIL